MKLDSKVHIDKITKSSVINKCATIEILIV